MIDIGLSKNHPSWPKFKAHLDGRIRDLREKNDNPGLTAEQTAGIRGEIAGLKALVVIVESAPDESIYDH